MGKSTWLVKAFLAMPFKLKVKFIKGFTGAKRYTTIPGRVPHVDMKELLMCALCPNMCRFECPSLRVTRKEMYAPATKARIAYHIEKGELDASDPHTAEVPYLCTNCNGCKHWCPMDISAGELLKNVRADLVEMGHVSEPLRAFNQNVKDNGTTFTKDTFKNPDYNVVTENPDIFYYMGCVMAEKKPEAVRATMAILSKAGITFSTHATKRSCCGGPLFTTGFRDTARELGEKNLALFRESGARCIVTDCPACADTIKNTYKTLGLKHDHDVYTTTEYFKKLIDEGKITPSKDVNMSITYHDPCITARVFNDTTTARYIFGKIPGLTVIEPFLHGVETQCCGMGGVSHVHHPVESEAIGKQRLDQLIATGAKKIVTACPACEEGFIIADGGKNDRDLDISEFLL